MKSKIVFIYAVISGFEVQLSGIITINLRRCSIDHVMVFVPAI